MIPNSQQTPCTIQIQIQIQIQILDELRDVFSEFIGEKIPPDIENALY